MSIFISSIILGIIGAIIGVMIDPILVGVLGLAGFSLPYAITLDRIYHILKDKEEKKIPEKLEEYTSYVVLDVPINKCPACNSEISESERECPSCGLELMEEQKESKI